MGMEPTMIQVDEINFGDVFTTHFGASYRVMFVMWIDCDEHTLKDGREWIGVDLDNHPREVDHPVAHKRGFLAMAATIPSVIPFWVRVP
jgi:hypothetical protein